MNLGDFLQSINVTFRDPNGYRERDLPNEAQQNQYQETKNMARYLQILAETSHGRGIQKSQQSLAQMSGLNPQNPQYFGMQRQDAIPYQKMLANGNNLRAVMKGYSEMDLGGNEMPADAAAVIAQTNHVAPLLGEAFNVKTRESLYAGVSKSPSVNLYNINAKNTRENSIYAFV